MSDSLTVVMPVYNEAAHLNARSRRSSTPSSRAGSTPSSSSSTTARRTGARRSAPAPRGATAASKSLRSPNRGRFGPRSGLEVADGRVRAPARRQSAIHPAASSSFTTGSRQARASGRPRVREPTESVRHVLERPRRSSPGASISRTHERRATTLGVRPYPKGTTCFSAPEPASGCARCLPEQVRGCPARERRHPSIRWIAARDRIYLSPSYAARTRPAYDSQVVPAPFRAPRQVFLDGHGRSESRFFPVVPGLLSREPVWAGVRSAASLRRPRARGVALALAGACRRQP